MAAAVWDNPTSLLTPPGRRRIESCPMSNSNFAIFLPYVRDCCDNDGEARACRFIAETGGPTGEDAPIHVNALRYCSSSRHTPQPRSAGDCRVMRKSAKLRVGPTPFKKLGEHARQ
jgi:hypothetical protein